MMTSQMSQTNNIDTEKLLYYDNILERKDHLDSSITKHWIYVARSS